MGHSRSVARLFSKASDYYQNGASLQREVAGQLLDYFSGPQEVNRVLELGCGTGFLTANIARRWPEAQLVALDLAPAMLRAMRRHLSPGVARAICADARQLCFSTSFDLVLSSASLQWMMPWEQLFGEIRQVLSNRGTVVLSVMLRGTLAELHQLRRELFPDKRPVLELPTADHLRQALGLHGFSVQAFEERVYQQSYPGAREFFRSIKELGFTGGGFSHSSSLLNRSEIGNLIGQYHQRYPAPGGGVTARYQVAFVTAVSK